MKINNVRGDLIDTPANKEALVACADESAAELLVDLGATLDEEVPLIKIKSGCQLLVGSTSPKLHEIVRILQFLQWLPREDYARSRPNMMRLLRNRNLIPTLSECERIWQVQRSEGFFQNKIKYLFGYFDPKNIHF